MSALASILYLASARISEVTRYSYVCYDEKILDENSKFVSYDWRSKQRGKEKPSVRKRDFKFTQVEKDGKMIDICLITLRNLKHKSRKVKELPITSEWEENRRLMAIVREYLSKLEDDDELFTFALSRGEKLIKMHLNWNCHWIRHLRSRHLVIHHGWNSHKLRYFNGWTDDRPASKYVDMNWKDLI